MALYETASSRLDRLIQDSLQPDAAFLGQVGRAVHEVCAFLREQCFAARPPPRPRVLKVVKVSAARAGQVPPAGARGRPDLDVVEHSHFLLPASVLGPNLDPLNACH